MAKKRIDNHTLQVLEYRQVLDILASYATSELGRGTATALYPSTDASWIRSRLAETSEIRYLLDQGVRIPLAGIRNIRPFIQRLGERQTLFTPEQLLHVADTLAAAARLRQFITDWAPSGFSHIQGFLPGLLAFDELTEAIDRCISPDQEIRDTASEKLRIMRGRIQALMSEIRRQFDRIVAQPGLKSALENTNFMTRHGRPVVAIRENYRASLRGTVLDRSKTGATLYIEPDSLIELNNELENAHFDEQKEIDRILWELTHSILQREADVLTTVKTLSLIDLAHAKARFSIDFQMASPDITETGSVDLRDARHPLLLKLTADRLGLSIADAQNHVIPISPRVGDDFQLLLITGPNTGGKTVLLKTLGLCVLMAQSGMHIPTHADSKLPVYRRIFADIGDEQSLEQSLSTFSAHMGNIVGILKRSDTHTLVLLDELGAGTDPDEGAALSTAVLDHLISLGGHIVATSHLGQLKTFAFAHTQAENACVSFDSETLEPTYRLIIGTPGTSNAIAIAQRLGMSCSLLEMAKAMLQNRNRDATELIHQLQQSRQQAEDRRQKAQTMLDQAKQTQVDAIQQLHEAKEEGERLLQIAEMEVENTMRDVRSVANQLQHATQNAPKAWRDIVLEAVLKVQDLAAQTSLAEKHQNYIANLQRGDLVYVVLFRRTGWVDRIRRKRGLISVLMDGKQLDLRFDQVCQPVNPQ